MFDIKSILSVLSGLVLIYAFFPYTRAIVRMETKPRKVTWLVWAVGDIIALAGQISEGATSGILVGAVIGASATFALSLRYGESGWTTRDRVCLGLSALAIILWIYFRDSSVGIALSLLALAVAAWPTWISAWENPENEDLRGWLLFNLSSLLGVLAIPQLTFADVAPPLVFLTIDVPMLYFLIVRPRWSRFKTVHLGW